MARSFENKAAESVARMLPGNLRALRRRAGWTQEQLGQRSRVSAELVSRLERGATRPTGDALIRLALALRVPIDAFYGWRACRLEWIEKPAIKCPHCGARAEVEAEDAALACDACGRRWLIAVWMSVWDGICFVSGAGGRRLIERLAEGSQQPARHRSRP